LRLFYGSHLGNGRLAGRDTIPGVRERALAQLLKDDFQPLLASQRLTVDTKPEKMDMFHDGTQVLSEVTGWHEFLRKAARMSDPITAVVLDLVDQHMLLQSPEHRVKSKPLCDKLRDLVRSAEIRLEKTNSGSDLAEPDEVVDRRKRLESLLYEIDKEADIAPSQPPPSMSSDRFTPGLPVDRKALKEQLKYVSIKKTSHRFGTIPEP
jgi:hypothetical protein